MDLMGSLVSTGLLNPMGFLDQLVRFYLMDPLNPIGLYNPDGTLCPTVPLDAMSPLHLMGPLDEMSPVDPIFCCIAPVLWI